MFGHNAWYSHKLRGIMLYNNVTNLHITNNFCHLKKSSQDINPLNKKDDLNFYVLFNCFLRKMKFSPLPMFQCIFQKLQQIKLIYMIKSNTGQIKYNLGAKVWENNLKREKKKKNKKERKEKIIGIFQNLYNKNNF